MPKQSTKSAAPQRTSPVPYAPGVTYEQLCTVRRDHCGVVQAGTLLAYNGAWDRKAVVSHVTYVGSYEDKYGYTQHEYTVGILPLGNIYADGRVLARRGRLYELQITTTTATAGYHDLGRLTPVRPHTPPAKGQPLLVSKHSEGATPGYGLHGYVLAAGNGGPTPAEATAHKDAVSTAKAKVKKPTPAPEAVLGQFIIQ